MKNLGIFAALLTLVSSCSKTNDEMEMMNAKGMLAEEASGRVLTQFVKGQINLQQDTITIPLYQGSLADGRQVWYVITDASTRAEADRLGVEYAPGLTHAIGQGGVRHATWNKQGSLDFDAGTVNFSDARQLRPGAAPALFPPTQFQPGSLADNDYSPFVEVSTDGQMAVYSAPIVAFGNTAAEIDFCAGNVDYTKVHDRVVSICPATSTVTIALSHGFANSHEVVYFSFDTNHPMAATMEAATYAPSMSQLAGTGTALDIFAVANGETGATNALRQGFNSALSGDGSPLNVLEGQPSGVSGYSPLWSLNLAQWSDAVVDANARSLLKSTAEFSAQIQAGKLSSTATGILINCPVVAILNE